MLSTRPRASSRLTVSTILCVSIFALGSPSSILAVAQEVIVTQPPKRETVSVEEKLEQDLVILDPVSDRVRIDQILYQLRQVGGNASYCHGLVRHASMLSIRGRSRLALPMLAVT